MTRHANDTLAAIRKRRLARRGFRLTLLALTLLGVALLTLMLGQAWVGPAALIDSLGGGSANGQGFIVRHLRLPRMLVSLLAGACFGLGGVAFQTLLRNPLASPDIIGITAGASTGAVVAIVAFGATGMAVSLSAVGAALGVALLVFLLAWRDGISGARLILIGIGIAAMLQSVTAWLLTQAPNWSLQQALRWMAGSVNGAQLEQVLPLCLALIVFGGALFWRRRDLDTLRLGDDLAAGLGVRLALTRGGVVVAAVGLVALATAMAGPIAFVAFLAGPIAARLVGSARSLLLPAALVGALLVLLGDTVGQHLLPSRYPVGIVTGVLGAPYLIYLIVRDNRRGGEL